MNILHYIRSVRTLWNFYTMFLFFFCLRKLANILAREKFFRVFYPRANLNIQKKNIYINICMCVCACVKRSIGSHNAFITNAVDFVGTLLNLEIRYLPNGFSCQIYALYLDSMVVFFHRFAEPLNRRQRGERGVRRGRGGLSVSANIRARVRNVRNFLWYITHRWWMTGVTKLVRNIELQTVVQVSSIKFARDIFSLHIETVETFVSYNPPIFFVELPHALSRLILEYCF